MKQHHSHLPFSECLAAKSLSLDCSGNGNFEIQILHGLCVYFCVCGIEGSGHVCPRMSEGKRMTLWNRLYPSTFV